MRITKTINHEVKKGSPVPPGGGGRGGGARRTAVRAGSSSFLSEFSRGIARALTRAGILAVGSSALLSAPFPFVSTTNRTSIHTSILPFTPPPSQRPTARLLLCGRRTASRVHSFRKPGLELRWLTMKVHNRFAAADQPDWRLLAIARRATSRHTRHEVLSSHTPCTRPSRFR